MFCVSIKYIKPIIYLDYSCYSIIRAPSLPLPRKIETTLYEKLLTELLF